MNLAEAHGEEAKENKILEWLNVEITAFYSSKKIL